MKCEYCGGRMVYIGTSNGAETYRCVVCGNQKSYVTQRVQEPKPILLQVERFVEYDGYGVWEVVKDYEPSFKELSGTDYRVQPMRQ